MSKKNVDDRFGIRGDLRIVRRDAKTMEQLSLWEKKNVITFGGPELIVSLLAPNVALGASVQQYSQIKSMRFGVDNTTPQRTDTDLIEEAIVGSPVRVQLLDADRVIGAAGTVEFSATLGSGDGNGVTYREAGLFSRGDDDDPLAATPSTVTMFSRQVFPDQPKTAAIVLEFLWRLTITV